MAMLDTPRQLRSRLRALTCVFAGFAVVASLTGATSVGPDSQPAPAPDTPRAIPYHEHPAAQIADRDQRVLDATSQLPGFGGAYVDAETGVLQVWLTEPSLSRAAAAQAALAETVAPEFADRSIEVRPADYTFAQLAGWRITARELLTLPGMTGLAIDETSNRLLVMVADLTTAGEEIRRELAGRDIPVAAVKLIEAGPFRPALQDDHRPLRGGTQIQFQVGMGGLFTATCTMGFTANRSGTTGFVTNSHCSRTMGAVDDGRYWQANRPFFDGNQVGIERVDPPFFVGGTCPEEAVCRLSDANFVENFTDEANIFLARIARLPFNTLDWNGTDQFRIMQAGFSGLDDPVTKIGRTTGRTAGDVIIICVDVQVAGTNIVQLCQDVTTAEAGPGDSGSPVFRITHSPNAFDVRLIGILWGIGELTDGTPISVVSPYPFVDAELDGIRVCPFTLTC